MTVINATVHPVYLPTLKPSRTDLDRRSACKLLSSTTTVVI